MYQNKLTYRKLMEGLRCIDDFTVRCLDREHRAYFNTLYAGTTQVIVDLCQEGSYQSGKYINLKVLELMKTILHAVRKHITNVSFDIYRLFTPCSMHETSSKWIRKMRL